MNTNGFTLIELVIVMVILGVLSAIAAPKFIDIQDEALQANLKAMEASLKSARSIVEAQILVRPDRLNNRQNWYTLDNGERIRVRGKLPEGRWNDTFALLVDFQDIAQVLSNNCVNNTIKWCVRQRGQGWFNSRGYANLGSGRGIIIYPEGNNLNQVRCYIYYINQNDSPRPTTVNPSIIGSDFTEC